MTHLRSFLDRWAAKALNAIIFLFLVATGVALFAAGPAVDQVDILRSTAMLSAFAIMCGCWVLYGAVALLDNLAGRF